MGREIAELLQDFKFTVIKKYIYILCFKIEISVILSMNVMIWLPFDLLSIDSDNWLFCISQHMPAMQTWGYFQDQLNLTF